MRIYFKRKKIFIFAAFAALLMLLCSCSNSNIANSNENAAPAGSKTSSLSIADDREDTEPETLSEEEIMLSTMTLEEKIGQMFLVLPDQLSISTPSYLHHDYNYGFSSFTDEMKESIKDYPVGGFALFHKHVVYPDQLKNFTAQMYENSKIVPIIVTDEEGGPLVARIANTKAFNETSVPSMGYIGSTGNTQLAKDAGATIGAMLKKYGINGNLGPVADLDSMNSGRVIADRSFGTDPSLVSEMVAAYCEGLHENNVLSCLKHFPGQGHAGADTHAGFSVLPYTMEELLEYDVIPFKENLENADMIMLSHISYPNITGSDLPTPFCKELVEDLLKNQLGYEGIIVTDALDMGAINNIFSSGEAVINCVKAGCDMVLMPKDFLQAFNALKEAVESGEIPIERIDESVLRILRVKSKIQH